MKGHTLEQANLIRLLLSAQPENVQLGFELLAQRPDKIAFVRVLQWMVALRVAATPFAEAEAFLRRHLQAEWQNQRAEVALFEVQLNPYAEGRCSTKQAAEQYAPYASFYEAYLEAQPQYASAYHYTGHFLRVYGLYQHEVRFWRVLTRARPEEIYYRRHCAKALLLAGGDWTERCHHLERAVVLPKASYHDFAALIRAQHHPQGDLAKALKWSEQCLRHYPDYAGSHVLKANVLAAQGRLAEAEALYQQQLTRHPRMAWLLHAYARYQLLYRKDALKAADVAEKAVRCDPSRDLLYRLTLAQIYWYGWRDAERAQSLLATIEDPDTYDADVERLELDIHTGSTQLPADF